MKASVRNTYHGTVMKIHRGTVNDEIEFILDGSDTRMTATISGTSAKILGIEVGKKVVALIKESWVILLTDTEGVKFATRNQLAGTVVSVDGGAVNAEVRVRLDGGEALTAIITLESAKRLELEAGSRVVALVKASNVVLGVPV